VTEGKLFDFWTRLASDVVGMIEKFCMLTPQENTNLITYEHEKDKTAGACTVERQN